MKEINVLILSAGRRVELVQAFQKAKQKVGINGKVVAADLSETAPALYFADTYHKICRIDNENYINEVIAIAQKENIHLIVPTIDTELLKLAREKAKIESQTQAKVHVSDLPVIEICRDKYNTQAFFEENGFGMPELITRERIEKKDYTLPLFIKPLNGSSSINTFKVNTEKELEFFLEYVPQPIVQGFIAGDEYTIDVFVDFEHNPITIVPRQRVATRGGEVLKGKIIKDQQLIEISKQVIQKLKPFGHITLQCMKTAEGVKFIEINPRFGGGAPMSMHVGADSAANLYRLLQGEKLTYNEDYQDQVMATRFDQAVYLDSNGKLL